MLEDSIGLVKIGNNEAAVVDVVFIHGLAAGSHNNWALNGKEELFWPRWIEEDFAVILVRNGVVVGKLRKIDRAEARPICFQRFASSMLRLMSSTPARDLNSGASTLTS